MHLDLLTSVFIRIRPRLMSRASGMLGDADDANDALQESFCKLWGRRKSITTEEQAEGLSIITVRNTCIDTLRRRNTYSAESMDIADDVQTDEDNTGPSTELIQVVEQLISSHLTERQSRILYLRDKAGAEISEIAEEFNISEANVRMILSRSRKIVRDCYMNLNRQK